MKGILKLALSVLPKQQDATLHCFTGRVTNAVGLDENAYAPGVPLEQCSIQPIDRSRYGYMGLDASKGYIAVYASIPIDDVRRDRNPDYIVWQGRKWEVVNRANWTQHSGFNGVVCMDVGPA